MATYRTRTYLAADWCSATFFLRNSDRIFEKK